MSCFKKPCSLCWRCWCCVIVGVCLVFNGGKMAWDDRIEVVERVVRTRQAVVMSQITKSHLNGGGGPG